MNNEPVVWILGGHLDSAKKMIHLCRVAPTQVDEGYIPLYTHPVNPKYDPETGEPLIDGYPLFSGLPHPVKELTDEEIITLWNDLVDRTILRKAQEK